MRREEQQIYLDRGDWCDITSIPPKKRREIFPQIPLWFAANVNKFCILFGTGEGDDPEVDSYNGNNDLRGYWIEEVKGTFNSTKDITTLITEDIGEL